MSNPSRFDKAELLSATGGYFFRHDCLRPCGYNIMQCEVRLKEDRSPLLPGTKCVLLLGKDAFTLWTGNTDNTLGEVRGSPYLLNNIPHIPSYLPQDCVDVKNYEAEFNEFLQKDYEEDEGKAKGILAEKRRHGKTARSNWRFWLKKDLEKAINIIHNDGVIPSRSFEPNYIIYPQAEEIIDRLLNLKDESLYLDIETDSNLQVTCCGLGFPNGDIYVVPLVTYNYSLAYDSLHKIIRALVIALRNNEVVSHNGYAFDWPVLQYKYKLPLGTRFYDTLLAQHRCYPEVEKSLGHCTSLWTHEPFHKDEACFNFQTAEQHRKLMVYCGKDVYTMMLIRKAIDNFARRIPGLESSIKQVNSSIKAYLIMTMTGIHFKEELRQSIVDENDRLATQYLRIINKLIGERFLREISGKSKKGMPGSNIQCVKYFHDLLHYPVIFRSQKTGKPSLGKRALYKLRLKHENPVIDFCLLYREVVKETGSLLFLPWKTKQIERTNNA